MKKLILLFVATIATKAIAIGQDLHFSQYQAAPMHISPALTGLAVDGGIVSAHYRGQWLSLLGAENAFQTVSATYEHRKNIKADFFGWGIGLWNDKAGAITHTQGKIAMSYSRQMFGKEGRRHLLVGGFEGSLLQRNIDLSSRRWTNQYDGNGGFDPNILAPTVSQPNFTRGDIGIGLSWYSLLKNGSYITGGVGATHLNRPDVSHEESTIFANLYVKYTAHFDAEFRIRRGILFAPSLLAQREGPSQQLMPSLALKIQLNGYTNDPAIRLGIASRYSNKLDRGFINDAMIASLRIDFRNISTGVSYDFTLSPLRTVNASSNAFEVMLAVKFAEKNKFLRQNTSPRYL